MKKIIDGKAYNTETATLLATVQLKGRKIIDERGTIAALPEIIAGETSLYETRGGAYFLVREVKEGTSPNPDYVRAPGSEGSSIYDSGLCPLTHKEAMAWAEIKEFDADKIESMFGKIAEAGEKSGTMLLRLPQGLKASVDKAAAAANQSANGWVMRCVERCMTDVTGRDHPILMKALAYAIVAIERLPKEWQEYSDKEDMKNLLEARTDENNRNHYYTSARSHLERRGVAIEDGKLVVAPRDPGHVVPLK